ncbi:hypothetical protein AB0M36_37490 [Actinoplanes sp. NPDC051346]|uniref:competence protein CoiA family protein n=1 Tax=Actinoplanes sp. NPDC051346 TaxID=3155048 RepID=UPI00341C80F8
MASKVFYVDLGVELDLRRPDLGCPQVPGLWDQLYGNVSRGALRCIGFARGQCQPGCPEWMYLKVSTTGRRYAAHLRHGETEWSPESNEHKALKERIARAAVAGGFEATIEDRGTHRRTDVLVRGPDVLLGCEPQLSPISVSSVRRRSQTAYDDRITPLWTTNSRTANVIDQAPWARIDSMPWRQYLQPDFEMPVRGGIRKLDSIPCTPGTVCNDRKLRQPCTGWNHQFAPVQLPRFDDLIVRAAAADLKPLKQQTSRGSVFFWAPASDVAEVVTATGPALVTTLGPIAVRIPPKNPVVIGVDDDDECTYGDDTFGQYPWTPRPRENTDPVPVQRDPNAVAREARAVANLDAFLAEVSDRGGQLAADPVRTGTAPPGFVGWRLPMRYEPVDLLIPDTTYAELRGVAASAPRFL